MQRKTIFIIIIVAVVFFAIAITGYILASMRINNIEKQGFINECEEFLASNNDFSQQYGKIISIETDDSGINKDTNGELNRYYMDFKCKTEKEEVYIRVYHT